MDGSNPVIESTADSAAGQATIDNPTTNDSNDAVKTESKNARKKRLRSEKLLSDPIFNTGKDSDNKDKETKEPKPLDWKKTLASAKKYAPKLEGAINTYFAMRKAMIVRQHEGGMMSIEPMTVQKYGKVVFYFDDKMDGIEGTIAEAAAFHGIVLSGNTTKFAENFIRKHPNLISFGALAILMVQLEYSMKANAALIAEIERRGREVADREYQKSKENSDIHVVTVDDGVS
jgi:hypothetical protein